MKTSRAFKRKRKRDGTWIDLYYSWGWLGRRPIWLVGVLSGSFCFLLGLGIAFLYGFQLEYTTTDVGWLAAFGVGWVSAWIRWGTLNLPDQLGYIRSCFVDDTGYQVLTEHWLRLLRSNRLALITSLVVAGIAWVVMYHGLFGNRVPPPVPLLLHSISEQTVIHNY